MQSELKHSNINSGTISFATRIAIDKSQMYNEYLNQSLHIICITSLWLLKTIWMGIYLYVSGIDSKEAITIFVYLQLLFRLSLQNLLKSQQSGLLIGPH